MEVIKMNIAIPELCDNVSRVFDFAHRLVVIETDGTDEINRTNIPINEKSLTSVMKYHVN